MRPIRKTIRFIAALLIVNMLYATFLPGISYALTSGPTAPEATSFEPVDTTDMVNLQTGDFTYNIPLLEVPGPAGGYPLALAYHAGIQPDEEASWVGLGWSLNPGAINRNVNGFADDHKDVQTTDRLYWEGGIRHNYNAGVSVGLPGSAASLSAGLSFSQDTYQGFGMGFYTGVSVGIKGTPLSVNAQVGLSPNGSAYGSAGLGANIGIGQAAGLAGNLSGGVGVSSQSGIYGSAGASVSGTSLDKNKNTRNHSVLGASIASGNGSKPSLSVGGGSGTVSNNKSGNISTSSGGLNLNLPTPISGLWISLGYNYQRYWIDESEDVNSNGALYFPILTPEPESLDSTAYDSYFSTALDDYLTSALFPNYDDYSVNAQGLSGSMRPYIFQGHIYNKNENNDVYNSLSYPTGGNPYRPKFRFDNDFSNQFAFTPADVEFYPDYDNPDHYYTPFISDFEQGVTETGENSDNEFRTGRFPGSRNVQYFTNNQIANTPEFLDTKSSGLSPRDQLPASQIGAFMVTNESGVTYHYCLPAYSYDEYAYSQNIKMEDGKTFNELKKPEKYAYTWLLTAVTGPDFIDRGVIGRLDSEDWGYWVEFDYGKWTDQYAWRNPGVDFQRDLDANFENFSEGRKEVYYLDAIQTKTHTALFVKEMREDAKSAIKVFRNITKKDGKVTSDKITDANKEGGYFPKYITNETIHGAGKNYYAKPVSSLKLKEIILIKSDMLQNESLDKSVGDLYRQSTKYTHFLSNGAFDRNSEIIQHFPENVLDIHDIEETLKSKALDVIKFNSDNNGLAPETSNSFSIDLVSRTVPITDPDYYKERLKSKLTLNSIEFVNGEGESLIPKIKFDYDLSNPNSDLSALSTINTTNRTYQFSLSNSGLEKGNILRFESNNKQCFALIYDISGGTHKIKMLGLNNPVNGNILWEETKNPPYNKDAFDIWGMYKSDVDTSKMEEEGHSNTGRIVTEISAKSLDAWSMKKITTSTGATINVEYEPDEYISASVKGSYPYLIESIEKHPPIPGMESFGDNFVKINIAGSFDFSSLEGQRIGRIAALTDPNNLTGPTNFIHTWNSTIQEGGKGFVISWDPFLMTTLQEETAFFHGGNLSSCADHPIQGGGIRTKEISVQSLTNKFSTVYEYNKGVTSYEPYKLNAFHLDFQGDISQDFKDYFNREFEQKWYDEFSKTVSNAREIPAPGVLYESIKIAEKKGDKTAPSHSVYEFEVYQDELVSHEHSGSFPTDAMGAGESLGIWYGQEYSKLSNKEITFRDLTSVVGNLKSIKLNSNEGELISETNYEYLHDDLLSKPNFDYAQYKSLLEEKFNKQGFIEETFFAGYFSNEYIRTASVNPWDEDYYILYRLVGKKVHYPSIPISEVNTNHKTGITTKTKNLAFDFYSGAITKTLATDGFGNTYISETVPAYRKYPGMGLATNGGANMLTQVASSKTYKADNDAGLTPVSLVSASAQTWSNSVSINIDNNLPDNGTTFTADLMKNEFCVVTFCVNTHYYLKNPSRALLEREVVNVNYLGTNYEAVVSEISSDEYHINFVNTAPSINEDTVYPIDGEHLSKYYQPDIWRKQASYSWIGNDPSLMMSDGLYQYQNEDGTEVYFEEFDNWSGATPSQKWQENSKITLYDINSHALEAIDINGNHAATKMDIEHERVFASVANAAYNEFAYSGAEGGLDDNLFFGGDVKAVTSSGIVLSKNPTDGSTAYPTHTGAHSLGLINNGTDDGKGFVFNSSDLKEGRTYRVSLWTNSTNGKVYYDFNNSSSPQYFDVVPSKKSGDWYLIEGDIAIDSEFVNLEIGAINQTTNIILFDDFRFHPIDAPMTSYVYDENTDELTYILDNNNLFTKYEYDAVGRLTNTLKESFKYGVKQISKVDYNYGRKYYDALDQIDADFTVSLHGVVDQAIRFQYGDNTSLGGTTTYTWNWGDGTSYTGATNPKYHSYTSHGTYDVGLVVNTTNNGVKASSKTINIYDSQFSFNIKNDGETSYLICSENSTNNIAQFNLSTLSDNVCPYDYLTWKYAVNNPDGSYSEFGSGTSATFTINDKTEGTYYIKCEGRDKCGYQVSATDVLQLSLTDGGNCQ